MHETQAGVILGTAARSRLGDVIAEPSAREPWSRFMNDSLSAADRGEEIRRHALTVALVKRGRGACRNQVRSSLSATLFRPSPEALQSAPSQTSHGTDQKDRQAGCEGVGHSARQWNATGDQGEESWWRCDENFPGPARRDKLLRINKMTATNRQNPDTRAAHDIRSCLQYSMGYVELLISGKGGPLTPKQIEYLTQIQIGNEKILDILNRMDQSDNLPPEF